MTERWLPVVGYEGFYDISDHGSVRRAAEGHGTYVGKILIPGNDRGYQHVVLCGDKHKNMKYIHRLVAAAFIGRCPDGKEINHINGVKSDNHLENLEYVTRSENIIHSYALGLSAHGEAHYRSKLTEENVHSIRALLGKETMAAIGRRFDVSNVTIFDIAKGKTWAWLKEA